MGEMCMCVINNRASPSFPEELDTDDSISRLILSNNLLYNLYSFIWESIYLGNFFSSKIVYVE